MILRHTNTVGHPEMCQRQLQPTQPVHSCQNKEIIDLAFRFTFHFAFACFRSFGKFALPSGSRLIVVRDQLVAKGLMFGLARRLTHP
jgi:hypothetical protein